MKNAKRWLAVLLSIAVVLTMAITPAMAAGTDDSSAATITVETVTKAVAAGEEVTLNVSLADNTGFAGLDFTVEYDQNKLELKSIVKGGLLSNGSFMPHVKKNKVVFADTELHSGDGALFTLKFTAKADSDNAKVNIVNNGFTGVHNEGFKVNIIPGGVNVPGSTGSTTGGSSTGGSSTGGSSTGGSSTGGSSTGGSSTGGSSTGGSSTGGSSTGGSTTGGSTTGGSTTGLAAIIAAIGNGSLPFNDVTVRDYFYDAVMWAVDRGITSGTSRYTFSPDAPCTRAQVVTFLWRAAGCPQPVSKVNPFTDVRADDYFYAAVLWAVENGITNGTSAKTFSPDATVTRAQVVTFLWRANGQPAAGNSGFADVSADKYYATAVAWAVFQRITTGTGFGVFSPDAACTRAQIVTFLYRAR